jgi:hypothetical protein
VASEVDICNIALGHIGDAANIQSIAPPDGSAQAEHCQRFYPIARDSMLEMHDWGFATKRVALAQLSTNAASGWAFAYLQPADLINTVSILDPNASSDTSVGMSAPIGWMETPLTNGGVYTPQPFQLETSADGQDIILTDMPLAALRYTYRMSDTTRFSPTFVDCVGWYLASFLAGPIMKGSEGAKMAASCRMIAFGQDGRSGLFGRAAASDANQKKANTRDRHQVAWINGR